MTPEEGMKGKFAASMSEDDRLTLKLLLDWVKTSETLRCVALARQVARTAHGTTAGKLFENYADQLLRTGGLKVEV